MQTNSTIVLDKLQSLANSSGFIIFSIDDYFVQFMKAFPSDAFIIFEAVSHNHLIKVPKSAKEKFSALNFSIARDNYEKEIRSDAVNNAVEEVRKIFTEIYQVDYDKPFQLTEQNDNSSNLSNSTANSELSQTQIGFIVGGLLILMALIYNWMHGKL